MVACGNPKSCGSSRFPHLGDDVVRSLVLLGRDEADAAGAALNEVLVVGMLDGLPAIVAADEAGRARSCRKGGCKAGARAKRGSPRGVFNPDNLAEKSGWGKGCCQRGKRKQHKGLSGSPLPRSGLHHSWCSLRPRAPRGFPFFSKLPKMDKEDAVLAYKFENRQFDGDASLLSGAGTDKEELFNEEPIRTWYGPSTPSFGR